jgi:nucleoside permease NupC
VVPVFARNASLGFALRIRIQPQDAVLEEADVIFDMFAGFARFSSAALVLGAITRMKEKSRE